MKSRLVPLTFSIKLIKVYFITVANQFKIEHHFVLIAGYSRSPFLSACLNDLSYKQLRPGKHDKLRGDKVIFVYHQVWYEGHASITLFVERVVFTLSLGHRKKTMVYMLRDSNRFSED